LQSLKDLKNIPKVEIRGRSSINDITGIGNHESLLFGACLDFEKIVGEYQNEQSTKKYFRQFIICINMSTRPTQLTKYGRKS
jgi:hypothetical protein